MIEKPDSEKTTDEILAERGAQYGNNWDTYTNIRRALKTNEPMHYSNCQRYCLDMIAMKLSRLVDGNANNADTWADIAGYAKLAQNNLPK